MTINSTIKFHVNPSEYHAQATRELSLDAPAGARLTAPDGGMREPQQSVGDAVEADAGNGEGAALAAAQEAELRR